ncbi:hypothetical protein R53653_IHELHDKM_00903 [Fructobacillus cardui]|nr:hypothetical protein R53653_IHELHDKM_00903 [Fructobacillus cardui]
MFTTFLILLIILYFYQWYHQKNAYENKFWLILPVLSFLAGWSNENTSGGALLIILVYLLLGKYYKKLKWTVNQLISIVTYLIAIYF